YTYTARDQLYTLTAPGSKVWTYTYNALGQPTRVDIPNGMHTEYAYDTRNRLTEIAHKDGSTVKQSFGYTLDDDGTITRITHEDGSYWDYGYDGRNRLISADRKSASGNIVAEYDYTYDDADNMLTKVEPFEDDFEDNNYTGWTVSGPWSASTGQMVNTADPGWPTFEKATTDASHEVRFDYVNKDASVWNNRLMVELRVTSTGEKLMLGLYPTDARLVKYVGGAWSLVDQDTSATTVQDETYHVRAV